MFGAVSAAVGKLVPVESLRWITFGHVESDECGSMNQWLALAPNATVAHGEVGCMVSLNDLADRPPRALQNGEALDLGGKRVRHVDTPHVPHSWDARVLFEETTATLFCGDLFTHFGNESALTSKDLVGPAKEAEAAFRASCLTPTTGKTIRTLAELQPKVLGVMHGSSFEGDCAGALNDLAAVYDDLHAAAS
jgi:flavorubredoxin